MLIIENNILSLETSAIKQYITKLKRGHLYILSYENYEDVEMIRTDNEDVLIIDTPEAFKHPSRHCSSNELISRQVKEGKIVILLTNSSHVLDNINLRVMLSKDFENKNLILENHPHLKSCTPIKGGKVRGFELHDGLVEKCKVNQYGVYWDKLDGYIADCEIIDSSVCYYLGDNK